MDEHTNAAAAAAPDVATTSPDPKAMNRRFLVAAVSAFAIADAGVARAQFQLLQGEGLQDSWRHCNNCFGLFYSPNNGPNGVCCFGGPHIPQGLKFQVYFSSNRRQPVAGRDSQFDWRFCDKCLAMFYDGGSDFTGRCPVHSADASGTRHKPQGFMFGLSHNNPTDPGQVQNGWRFCDKCWSLFYGTAPAEDSTGFCPSGGKHHAASNSFDFDLPFTNNWVNAPPPPPRTGQFDARNPANQPSSNGSNAPKISASSSGGSVRVTGGGFLPNRQVRIRIVVNTLGNEDAAFPISNAGGGITASFACPAGGGNAVAVSATDGRTVPPSVSRDEILWSNAVVVNCQ